MKTIQLLILLHTFLMAQYHATISPLSPQIKKQMLQGNSWKKGCPVALHELRYLQLSYRNFQGKTVTGELIVHQAVAEEVTHIFKALYQIGYPIHRMQLVSRYKGSDWRSIEADNTSAFNCRKATGSKHWSKHSYGKAIDLNPIENPYVSRVGHISHQASQPYRKRIHRKDTAKDKALLLKHDQAVQIFKKYGWRWGGEWSSVKDYQHFSK